MFHAPWMLEQLINPKTLNRQQAPLRSASEFWHLGWEFFSSFEFWVRCLAAGFRDRLWGFGFYGSGVSRSGIGVWGSWCHTPRGQACSRALHESKAERRERPIPTLGDLWADLSRDRSACLDSAYAHSSPSQYDQSCKPEIPPSPRARERPPRAQVPKNSRRRPVPRDEQAACRRRRVHGCDIAVPAGPNKTPQAKKNPKMKPKPPNPDKSGDLPEVLPGAPQPLKRTSGPQMPLPSQ